MNSRPTLLKLLLPTEHAFLLYVKREALVALTDKTEHTTKPGLRSYGDFGWSLVDDILMQSAWPQHITNSISCACTEGSSRNCSCIRKGISCYTGCRYQGSDSRGKYSSAKCTAESEDSSDTDSDTVKGKVILGFLVATECLSCEFSSDQFRHPFQYPVKVQKINFKTGYVYRI